MSLHAELSAGTPCKVCAFLGTLTPEARAEWEGELRQPVKSVGNTAVVNALFRRNVNVTEAAVRRHRSRHA